MATSPICCGRGPLTERARSQSGSEMPPSGFSAATLAGLACLLAALALGAGGCGGDSPTATTTITTTVTEGLEPEVEAAPVLPGADELPRAGDRGARFGYNEDLSAGAPKLFLLPGSGADMVRTRLSWNWIEREPGRLDWSMFDTLYEQLLALGVRPLWILVEAPCWAADPRPALRSGAVGGSAEPRARRRSRALSGGRRRALPRVAGNRGRQRGQRPGLLAGRAGPRRLRRAAAGERRGGSTRSIRGWRSSPPGSSRSSGAQEGRLPWRDFIRAIVESGAAKEIDAFAFHPYAQLAPAEDPGPATGALVDELSAYATSLGAGGRADLGDRGRAEHRRGRRRGATTSRPPAWSRSTGRCASAECR